MNTINDLPLTEIDEPAHRARDLDPAWAEGLAGLIEAQGLTNPITVRRDGATYRLVTGLHRMEAFRLLGRETIPARLSAATSDDEARLEEVMENLGRHELIALDRCHHLYELKQVWERMYPQAKNGGNKNVEKGRRATRTQTLRSGGDGQEIFSFAKATAEKIGLSKRAIEQAVRIWTRLVPSVRRRLAGTDLARKQTELKALADLSAAKQMKVLDLIFGDDHPGIENVAEALFYLDNGVTPSRTERQFMAMSKSLKMMDDPLFDEVIAAHGDRVIASLKRIGRI